MTDENDVDPTNSEQHQVVPAKRVVVHPPPPDSGGRFPKWFWSGLVIPILATILGAGIITFAVMTRDAMAKVLAKQHDDLHDKWEGTYTTKNVETSKLEVRMDSLVKEFDRQLSDRRRSADDQLRDLRSSFEERVENRLQAWRSEQSDRDDADDDRRRRLLDELKGYVSDAQRTLEEARKMASETRVSRNEADRSVTELRSKQGDIGALLSAVEQFKSGTDELLNRLREDIDGRTGDGEPSFVDRLVEAAGQSALPVGTIMPWPGRVVPNEFWAICDGGTVDDPRGYLAKVFAGTKFNGVGPVEGSQFRLPDLRGMFLRGFDGSRTVDPEMREIGQLQEHEFASHNHVITVSEGGRHDHEASASSNGSHSHSGTTNTAGNHTHDSTDLHGSDAKGAGGATGFNGHFHGRRPARYLKPAGSHSHSLTTDKKGSHSHTVTVQSAPAHLHDATSLAAGGAETRPVNVAINWIVKVRDRTATGGVR